jgi:hydroxymethylbilane synthase
LQKDPTLTLLSEPASDPRRRSHLRIGTRASALARWQADWVAARLREMGVEVELVLLTTSGDQQLRPIGELGEQGVFTKEIQRAVLEGRVDLAIHSLKDLPTEGTPGLLLAAVPPRAPQSDVLVCRRYASLDELPGGSRVGTGSLRRRAQLLHFRPDLAMKDIRGNVDTRLRKLDEGEFDALILAEAGLRRLELSARICQVLPQSVCLPAAGQGALGLEARSGDSSTRELLRPLDDPTTHAAVLAERTMLAELRGGCLAPVAAWGRREGPSLVLTGRVLSPDGRRKLEASVTGDPASAADLGRRAAAELLAQGAAELIRLARP